MMIGHVKHTLRRPRISAAACILMSVGGDEQGNIESEFNVRTMLWHNVAPGRQRASCKQRGRAELKLRALNVP